MSLYNDLTAVLTPYANKIKQNESDIGDMRTATVSDVGKALKAKTVTDGKVTEWEFGAAGGEIGDLGQIETDLYKSWGVSEETYTPTITSGESYNAATGEVKTTVGFKRTDLIDVSKWASAIITVYGFESTGGVCFYDSSRTFISTILNDQTRHTDVPVTFPQGTKYIGISSHQSVDIKVKAYIYISFADTLDAMRTATSSDIGKALMPKTIENEKVIEWEFGEVGDVIKTDTSLTENGVPADANATGGAINGIKHAWGTVIEQIPVVITSREYYKTSDGSVGTYIACERTDLIDLTNWKSAIVTCYSLSENYAGVVYYDKDMQYISGEYSNGKFFNVPMHIPENAAFVGVSTHNSVGISVIATRYVTPEETADTVVELKNKILDGYIDKNIVLFGDSITTELHKYVPALKQIMSFKSLTNYARGYCKWSFYADTVYDITSTGNTASSDNVIWNQYNRLVADVSNETVAIPDAIIIMAGTNDAIYNSNLGTVSDAMAITDIRTAQVGTLNNVCASIRRVIEDIFATFPYTKIIICTPIQQVTQNTRLMNIASCIRELCEYYSIEIPDMFKNVGISYYVEKDADVYLSAGDGGIHPTEAGGKLMANFMKAWLQSHYSYDETIEKTYVPQT